MAGPGPAPAGPNAPAAKKSSSSRMMYLMPLMFMMNRLDFTNPTILWTARIAFIVTQVLSLGIFYLIQRRVLAKNDTRKIYVPGIKSPFDQSPNYAEMTETTYVKHESTKCTEFMKQTLIGAGIASFVHVKMGVTQVVLIQALMTPMNLYDNPLVRAWIFHKRDGRVWNEKLEGEPMEEEEPAAAPAAPAANASAPEKQQPKKPKMSLAGVTPSEAIAQALAQEVDADYDDLWEVVKKDVNAATTDDQWTALMVACGSPLDTDDFIRKMIKAGADVTAADSEGWTALHWSAFHGRPEAAETLLECATSSEVEKLLAAKDAKNRTAMEIAKEEGNEDVVEVITKASGGAKAEESEDAAELRRRKPATSVEDVD